MFPPLAGVIGFKFEMTTPKMSWKKFHRHGSGNQLIGQHNATYKETAFGIDALNPTTPPKRYNLLGYTPGHKNDKNSALLISSTLKTSTKTVFWSPF